MHDLKILGRLISCFHRGPYPLDNEILVLAVEDFQHVLVNELYHKEKLDLKELLCFSDPFDRPVQRGGLGGFRFGGLGVSLRILIPALHP